MQQGGTNKLAESIFQDLQARILRGDLPAGARLPSERELAPEYNTNRNTLREAVRKLEQARLVTVRQGQGVTVADFRRTGMITVIGPYLEHTSSSHDRLRVFHDVLVTRTGILEMAVAMAASRAQPDDIARLRALARVQADAFASRDRKLLVDGDVELIEALVDAAHSLTVRWIANTLLDAFRYFSGRIPAMWLFEASYPAHLERLTERIAAGDAAAAASQVREYYGAIDARLGPVIEAALVSRSNTAAPADADAPMFDPAHDQETSG